MPPSRRNLIVIACLCLVTIYVAASVRYYRGLSEEKYSDTIGLSAQYFPYAPYTVPVRTEPSFYEKTTKKPAVVTKPQSKPAIPPANLLGVKAQAYIVGDIQTGKIYLEKNSRAVLPVASMSKLITAFVATDVISPDAPIYITPEEADLPPDGSKLEAGETFQMKEILYPLLLSSSNVAAEAIASATSDRSNFLEQMSSYAWEVGMSSSFFADASGLSPSNAASARDLFLLARYLYKSRPDILAITRTPHFSIATTSDHGSHEVESIHPFVNDPDFIGGKTGRTPEAGETMMTLMRVNNRPIGVIVLGSPFGGREADTRLLLQAAEKVFK